MAKGIKNITIKGFKSIKTIDKFALNDLNIIIGANGAGKSNFIQVFHLLSAMVQKNLSGYINEKGGSDNFLFNGPKATSKIELEFDFTAARGYGENSYHVELTPTVKEDFLVNEHRKYYNYSWRSYGPPSSESRIADQKDERSYAYANYPGVGYYIFDSISNWVVYHFHDTSSLAPMRRSEIIEDNKRLRGNASNIAPFLLELKTNHKENYDEILNAIRLVMPFFDDFILDIATKGEESRVKLSWKQKGSDFPMQPYHLSDGSIRFICLATALLQPNPPSTIVIDEPELGLHPAAIAILSELLQAAAKNTQVIVATQSPMLIDYFSIDDIIVMSREYGSSCMKRLDPEAFSVWLEDYSVGELWTKNVIEGGPVNE